MSLKLLSLHINRFKNIASIVQYSSYFEKDVLHIYNKDNIQFHVFVSHINNDGSMLVKIVTLGVSYAVTKLITFSSTKNLVDYLNKSLQS